jgi:hypothetical protein
MKSKIINNNSITCLLVHPESPEEVSQIATLIQAFRDGTGTVLVFLDEEPSTRAASISPSDGGNRVH